MTSITGGSLNTPNHAREGYQHFYELTSAEDVTFPSVGIGSLCELTGQDLMAPNIVPAVLFKELVQAHL